MNVSWILGAASVGIFKKDGYDMVNQSDETQPRKGALSRRVIDAPHKATTNSTFRLMQKQSHVTHT
jgi:hypothetical protein